jgi:hypothetical protein
VAVKAEQKKTKASGAKKGLVAEENAREGSLDWQLTRVRIDNGATGYRGAAIEGYASRQSVKAGEKIDFFVSTKPAERFEMEALRWRSSAWVTMGDAGRA